MAFLILVAQIVAQFSDNSPYEIHEIKVKINKLGYF